MIWRIAFFGFRLLMNAGFVILTLTSFHAGFIILTLSFYAGFILTLTFFYALTLSFYAGFIYTGLILILMLDLVSIPRGSGNDIQLESFPVSLNGPKARIYRALVSESALEECADTTDVPIKIPRVSEIMMAKK